MDLLIDIANKPDVIIYAVITIYLLACAVVFVSGKGKKDSPRRAGRTASVFLYSLFFIPLISAGSYVAWPMFTGTDPGSFASEAEELLTSIATAQIHHLAENGSWAGQYDGDYVFSYLGWDTTVPTHYAYYCGNDYILSKSGKFKFEYPEPGEDWPYTVAPEITLTDFICMAVGNNDKDDIPDVWMVNKYKAPVHLVDDSKDEMLMDIWSEPFDLRDFYAPSYYQEGDHLLSRVSIDINIPAYRLDLFYDDYLIRSYRIAVGRRAYKTPRRKFHMKRIEWNPWWYPPNAKWARGARPRRPGFGNPLGPVKMVLGRGILIHGTNKPHTIGYSASHGCIRMLPDEAVNLAWNISVLAETKRPTKSPQEYASRPRRTFRAFLQAPVPVRIAYKRVEVSGDWLMIHPDPYWKRALKPYQIEKILAENGLSSDALGDNAVTGLAYQKYTETAFVPLDKSIGEIEDEVILAEVGK